MMMNFDEQEQEQEQEREYCGHKEEELQEGEEEEDEDEMMATSKLPFPPPSSSSSSSCTMYRNFLPPHENLWIGSSENSQNQEAAFNFDNKVELIDLSLGNDNGTVKTSTSGGAGHECIEREHMFDKAVTPSDVGKLNRLVIPKQHAEKYFPLDSSSNEKGLLLNFEDRNGKPWRFRYSYWNSSQSYVMTKGWSRFVKEKKLDAGDIVSFQRGVGESGKHRLYIDWRRTANAPDPASFTHLELQNQLQFPQSVRWGRVCSLPQPLSSIPRPYQQSHHHHQFQHLNYTLHQPYHHHHPPYYSRSSPAGSLQIGAVHHYQNQQGVGDRQAAAPMVIDSIPVVHGRSVGKRLRLFGVNMECTIQDDFSSLSSSVNTADRSSTMVGSLFSPHLPTASTSDSAYASSLPPPSSGALISVPASTTHQAHEFSKKGKTSLSFDLDL